MKKLSILVLAVMCASAVAAQRRVVVSVLSKTENEDAIAYFNNYLLDAFVKKHPDLYEALENNDDFLAAMNKELEYQRSGAVDENHIIDLAKHYGADVVCIAKITEVFGSKSLNARLNDAKTRKIISSEILPNANYKKAIAFNSIVDLVEVSEYIAQTLTDKSAKEKHKDQQVAEAEAQREQAERLQRLTAAAAAEQRKEEEKTEARRSGFAVLDNLAVQVLPSGDVDFVTAYKMCGDASRGGFDDWRLPSVGELTNIYTYRERLYHKGHKFDNPFSSTSYYWSQDECGSGSVSVISGNGSNECYKIKKTAKAICVRNHKSN
jgi:hypothetical protein